MTRVRLLPLLLLLGCAGQKPAPQPPARAADVGALFAGCEGQLDADGSYDLDCEPLTLIVVPVGDETSDEVLQAYLKGIRSEAKGEVQERWGEAQLAGARRKLVRSSAPLEDEGKLVPVESVAFVDEAQPRRLFVCARPVEAKVPEERCLAMLEELVQHGVPKSVPMEQPPAPGKPALLGRPLPVPEGCSVPEAGPDGATVSCAKGPHVGELWWMREQPGTIARPDHLPRLRDAIAAHVEKQAGLAVVPKETSPACTIAGAPGTCRKLVYGFPQGTLIQIIGTATVDGAEISAGCSLIEDQGPNPLCDSVFQLQ